jgi:hypothetical protein
MRVWIQAFPPAERDRGYQQRFAPLGLFESESPCKDPDSKLVGIMREGLSAGRQTLESGLANAPSPEQNGWKRTYHIFDHNLDYFEVGALNEDRWIGFRRPPARSGRSCVCTSPTRPCSTAATSWPRSRGRIDRGRAGRQPGRAWPLYSGLGSMLVAMAMRLVRLYIALISATSHASSSVRPTSSSVWRSARVISRGRSVSFSA